MGRKPPVDVKAVLEEALRVDEARQAPVRVGLYLDETAPGELQAHVRQAFASASPAARVTIGYLGERPFVAAEGDDMAVVVAGIGESVGACAAALRGAGMPVLVATTLPVLVEGMAAAAGFPIPQGDIAAPPAPRRAPGEPDEGPADEPYALDEAAARALDARMGGWILEACGDRQLAFAMAFPFVRRPLALDAVNRTALQNAAVGLLPIIPGADMPVMTLNQSKMVIMIAAAYGEELGPGRAKEIAAVVAGALGCRRLVRSLGVKIPVVGWAVKGAVGYAGTLAMGHAAIRYFEGGVASGALDEAIASARARAEELVAQAGAQGALEGLMKGIAR